MTHPHAYSDITIQNGQVKSKTCIEKQPGSIIRIFLFLEIEPDYIKFLFKKSLSLFRLEHVFKLQCNVWRRRTVKNPSM